MMNRADHKIRWARLIGLASLLIALLVSGMSLVGRVLNIEVLTNLNPHGIPMRIVTAICFLLVAAALTALQTNGLHKWKARFARLVGVVVSVIGLVTLATYLVEFNTGTEWLGGHHPLVNWFLDQDTTRMAVITAMLFAIFGWIVFLLGSASRRAWAIGHVLLLPVAVMTYLILVGYTFGIRAFYEWMSLGVALNSGIAFCSLCVAAMCIRPHTWLTSVFTSVEAGGVMARRLLPALLLLPLLIGWLRLQGERSGLFASEVGVAIVAVTYTVCFLVLVWLSARSVNRTDQGRRRAEEAQSWLAMIVESSDDAILSKDLAGTVLTWNAGAQRLFGYRADEVVGRSIALLLPPDRVDEEERMLERLKAGERIEHVETVRVAKDGRQIDVLVTSSPVKDQAGRIVGASKIIRDITDRKRAERALAESEGRLTFALETTETGAWDLDLIDHTAHRSLMHDRIFGYETLLPQWTFEMFLEHVLPEDREEVSAKFSHAVETRTDWAFECRIRRADGEVRWIWAGGRHRRDASGEVRLMSGVVQDITDRKRAEEALHENERRLRTILDALPVAIFLSDPAGKIIFTNTAVERIWGLNPHVTREGYGQYKGRWLDSGLAVEPEQWALARTLDTGQPFVNDPVELELPDGSRKIIHNFALPIRDQGGQSLGVVVVTEDVTQRVHAQEQVRQAKEAAEHAADELARSNKDLEQFAYVSSHDLQEPLRMVTGFMQLLNRNYGGKLDATADKYIGYAVDGAKRMQQLIEDLLAYSRVGSKARDLVPTDAGGLVQAALSNLSVAIEEAKAQITVGAMPSVLADGPQIVQVFQNLIGNAIKFRGDQPPIIDVSACRDGDMWLFAVKDNGIGFSPEFHDKVFMIFQRLHTKDKYPGTGIGLAVCKKIIERHHGQIWAESTLGHGSTFYFTLPA